MTANYGICVRFITISLFLTINVFVLFRLISQLGDSLRKINHNRSTPPTSDFTNYTKL